LTRIKAPAAESAQGSPVGVAVSVLPDDPPGVRPRAAAPRLRGTSMCPARRQIRRVFFAAAAGPRGRQRRADPLLHLIPQN